MAPKPASSPAVLAPEAGARAAAPPRPCSDVQHRVAAARSCCRCAARWSRRYCPSRSADVAQPGRPGQQQPEGDRAQQVAERRAPADADVIRRSTRRPAFQVPTTRPSSARPSKGVFCALPGKRPSFDLPGAVEVEQHQSAGRALGQPAGFGRPSSVAGRAVSRSSAAQQRQAPPCTRASVTPSSVASPAPPGVGLGEGQPLVVGVARLVVGGDGVDRAVGQRRDHRQPVGLRPQRRRQLGIGAEVADRRLVQVEIGRGGVAGDRQAPRPWRARISVERRRRCGHGRNARGRR